MQPLTTFLLAGVFAGPVDFGAVLPPVPPFGAGFRTVPEGVRLPFDRTPQVRVVEQSNEEIGGEEDGAAPSACGYSAVFDTPAHFPVPAFTQAGLAVPGDAIVIYEGMSLALQPTGEYEVRFVVEAPATDITLLLQFEIWQNGQYSGTVTLPPVRLDSGSADEPRGNLPSRSWTVKHNGYSHRLARLASQPPGPMYGLTITRHGTARCGTLPR